MPERWRILRSFLCQPARRKLGAGGRRQCSFSTPLHSKTRVLPLVGEIRRIRHPTLILPSSHHPASRTRHPSSGRRGEERGGGRGERVYFRRQNKVVFGEAADGVQAFSHSCLVWYTAGMSLMAQKVKTVRGARMEIRRN